MKSLEVFNADCAPGGKLPPTTHKKRPSDDWNADRHGTRRVRFRKGNFSTYLTGIPWSEEFMRQYAAALDPNLAKVTVGRVANLPTPRPVNLIPGLLSPTGWTPPSVFSEADWIESGLKLWRVNSGVQWWLEARIGQLLPPEQGRRTDLLPPHMEEVPSALIPRDEDRASFRLLALALEADRPIAGARQVLEDRLGQRP